MLFFCLFQCFEEKEYQRESKRDETFGNDLFGTNANLETWSGSQETREAGTGGAGAPPRAGGAPPLGGPSGGALAKAPRWDLADTEGCGGGIRFSWSVLMFSGYVGIYRRKKYLGGRPRGPRGRGRA